MRLNIQRRSCLRAANRERRNMSREKREWSFHRLTDNSAKDESRNAVEKKREITSNYGTATVEGKI